MGQNKFEQVPFLGFSEILPGCVVLSKIGQIETVLEMPVSILGVYVRYNREEPCPTTGGKRKRNTLAQKTGISHMARISWKKSSNTVQNRASQAVSRCCRQGGLLFSDKKDSLVRATKDKG